MRYANPRTLLIYVSLLYFTEQELQTALHMAARQGDVDGVELLLQRGAAPNCVTTDLNTPLHGAAREGHENVAKVLIAHGANMALANKVRVYHAPLQSHQFNSLMGTDNYSAASKNMKLVHCYIWYSEEGQGGTAARPGPPGPSSLYQM